MYCLNCELIQAAAERLVHGVGRPRLNLVDIRTLPLPVVPLAEQVAAADLLDSIVSIEQNLQAEIALKQKHSIALRQSILASAFTGKLVPQDPDDEPASVLVERIREERAAAVQNAGRRRHAGRRGQSSKKGEPAMVKTRKEINPTHLRDIVRTSNGGIAPEALWKASELDIDDFYKQLRDEVDAGHLREERDGTTSRIVCQ
jgi:hypothetical protein